MMDLLRVERNIVNYIEENCEKYLELFGLEKPQITREFLNLDRFKRKFTCFVNLHDSGITFSDNSYQTDCMKTMTMRMSIFLLFRDDVPETMEERMLNGSSAFYELMSNPENRYDLPFNRISVRELRTFPIVAANKQLLGSELEIEIDVNI